MPGSAAIIFTRFATNFGMWEAHAQAPYGGCPGLLVGLHERWSALRAGDRPPGAEAFAPERLPRPVADHSALVDLRGGVRAARYLRAGNTLVKLYGAGLAGRPLSNCYRGEALAEVRAAYDRMLAAGGPVFTERTFRVFDAKLGYHRLLLPLAGEGTGVEYALLGVVPKGGIHSAIDWRELETELALADLEGMPGRG